jgi:hypothetical protein
LKILGLIYETQIRCLYCPSHNYAITPSKIQSHFKSTHQEDRKQTGINSKKAFEELLEHLSVAFNLTDSPKELADRFPPLLRRPLPVYQLLTTKLGNPSPIAYRYSCEYCTDKPTWYQIDLSETMTHGITRHINASHKGKPMSVRTLPELVWRLRLGPKEYHFFRFPNKYTFRQLYKDWKVGKPRDAEIEGQVGQESEEHPSPEVPWEHSLGWAEYARYLEEQGQKETILYFVRPLIANPLNAKFPENRRWTLEYFLDWKVAQLRPLLVKYLINASEYSRSLHGQVVNSVFPR